MVERLDLLEFVKKEFIAPKTGNIYEVEIRADNEEIKLDYFVTVSNKFKKNCGKRHWSSIIQRFISRNIRTFETIGLLQAEMSKTHDRKISFSNSEPNIINLVLEWFNDELKVNSNEWKWYIKVNLKKPEDLTEKLKLENNVKQFWITNTILKLEKMYKTPVTYVKNTNNTELANNGTAVIELNSKFLTQLAHNILIKFQTFILTCSDQEIAGFMRGIIAGEGCIEINRKFMKYNVHISACKEEERLLYKECLAKLGIELKVYENYKETIISKKKNNFKLLDLDLMNLNPTKYAKFLEMISLYGNKKKV